MAAKPKGREEMLSGLGMCLLFGALWIFLGGRFWIFPLVFAGVLPAIRGATRFLNTRKVEQKQNLELEQAGLAAVERSILQRAKLENGRVTPALIALHTDISIHDADTALQEMVKQGYATMDVSDNGTVIYVFQEFVPEIE